MVRWLHQQVSSLSESMVAYSSTEQVPERKQREQFQAIPHKFDPALFYGGTHGWCGNGIGQDKQAFSVPKICLSFVAEFVVKDHFWILWISLEQLNLHWLPEGAGLDLSFARYLFWCNSLMGYKAEGGMTVHVNSCHCSLWFCLFFFRQGQCWRHHWAAKAWKAEEVLRCTNCHTQHGHTTMLYAALLGSNTNIRKTCNTRECRSSITSSQQFFESQRKVTLIRCLAWNKWALKMPPIWQQP